MISETLLHIDESLNPAQRRDLLAWLGNRAEGLQPRMQSDKEHLLFVAYNPEEMCPHDLVAIVGERGLHAQLIDL
ncbi:hypothetical protein [Sulfurivermis fontis]|jgi:hypothetical protein|uniref:hypothetical protein n=1 Tax=Sulfurivermis fontis TaxID=1972068 RepID=UPI000FD7044B|nr:hypothetical protein [Sulfurivermis fontis]